MDEDVIITKIMPASHRGSEFNHLLLTQPIKQEHTLSTPSISMVTGGQLPGTSFQGNRPTSSSIVLQNQPGSQFRSSLVPQNQGHMPYFPVQGIRNQRPLGVTGASGPVSGGIAPPQSSLISHRPVLTSSGSSVSMTTGQHHQQFASGPNSGGVQTMQFMPRPAPSGVGLRSVVRPQRMPLPHNQSAQVQSNRYIRPMSTNHQSNGGGPSSSSPSANPAVVASSSSANNSTAPRSSTSTAANLQWGRALRDPQGNTVFHGIPGLQLSSSESVLSKCCTGGSQCIPLDPVKFLESKQQQPSFEVTQLLKGTPAEVSSRKGFHKCVVCCAVYLSGEMYNDHINRQIYLIEYKCPDCATTLELPNRCALMLHLRGHSTTNVTIDPLNVKVSLLPLEKAKQVSQLRSMKTLEQFRKIVEETLPNWDFDLHTPFIRLAAGRKFYLLERAKESTGLAPCAMCDFTPTAGGDTLLHHLLGGTANSNTKCALCSLVVPINREAVCAFKAHILLHMGIYVMCPRCGFTAPTDLSPPEAEEVMRLHLRFVCFHFNVVQIYVCSRCTSGRAFNSVLQYTTHIYEEHAVKRYRCNVCYSENADRSNCEEDFATLHLVIHHLQTTHRQEMMANEPRLYSTPSKCPECPRSFTNKQEFIDHHVKYHNRTCNKGKTAYRCFGECKQIHREFADLRDHVTNCVQMKAMTEAAPPNHYFCLFCGIGARRRAIGPGTYVASYKCTYLDNLPALHQHEAVHLNFENNNGGHTACPWCKEKMPQILESLLEHMRSHLKENRIIAEAIRRNEEYSAVEGVEVPCHCRFPLDSAQALESHANCPDIGHMPIPREILDSILSAMPPTQPDQLVCVACQETKDSLWSMVEHTFHSHKNEVCYICLKYSAETTTKGRRQLWRHIWKCIRHRMPSAPDKSTSIITDETNLVVNGFAIEDSNVSYSDPTSNQQEDDSGELQMENIQPTVESSESVNESVQEDSVSMTTCNITKNGDGAQATPPPTPQPAPMKTPKSYHPSEYDCSLCSRSHIDEEELTRHWTSEHGFRLAHCCHLCGVKFSSRAQLTLHVAERHERALRGVGVLLGKHAVTVVLDSSAPNSYRCHLCSKKFDKRTSCEKHMMHSHKFQKSDINWGLLTESSDVKKRIKHEAHNTSSTESLPAPSKRLRVESSGPPLHNRSRLPDGNNPSTTPSVENSSKANFECAHCEFESSERQPFLQHLLTLHRPPADVKELIYLCVDCGMSYISKKALSMHLLAVHKIRDVQDYLDQWGSYIEFNQGECRSKDALN